MGGVCMWCAGSCRPVWPVFIILASLPCVLHCSDSPAAVVGKMYPRGNHWAVGHLMGKKSIEGLPEPQETDGDYLTPSDTAEPVELSSYERLMQALIRQTNQKQMKAHIPQRLLGLRSGWRAEDRDKYLREMSDLLLLALKLQDDDAA